MKITKEKCCVYSKTLIKSESGEQIATANSMIDEAEANAELIAEAFNVANETGRSPRELAEINKQLLEMLIHATEKFEEMGMSQNLDTVLYRKTILKATSK